MKGGLQRKAFLIILGAFPILIFLSVILYKQEHQPLYEGETVGYWVNQYKRCLAANFRRSGSPSLEEMAMLHKAEEVFEHADPAFLIAAFEKAQTPLDAFIRSRGPGINSKLPIKWRLDVDTRKQTFLMLRFTILTRLSQKNPLPREALPVYLASLLGPYNTFSSSDAAAGLRRLGPDAKEAIPALIEGLGGSSIFLRREIISVLTAISVTDKRTISALMKLLEDTDAETRLAAAQALIQVPETSRDSNHTEAIIHAVVPITVSPKTATAPRLTAINSLIAVAPSDHLTSATLLRLLEHREASIRLAAAEGLVRIDPNFRFRERLPDVVAALKSVLKNGSSTPSWRAVELLGELSTNAPGTILALAQGLKHSDNRVRWKAATALGKIGPAASEAVPSLAEALHDEYANVREATADALKKIQDEAVSPKP